MVATAAVEWNKEKKMKGNENNLRDYWDSIKFINIQIIGVTEEEK